MVRNRKKHWEIQRQLKQYNDRYGNKHGSYKLRCLVCDSVFYARHPRAQFCSERCTTLMGRHHTRQYIGSADNGTYPKICVICKKQFLTNNKDVKCCSDECRKKYQEKNQTSKICTICGIEYESSFEDSEYCSVHCRLIASLQKQCDEEYLEQNKLDPTAKPLTVCVVCGKKFEGSNTAKYCSKKCSDRAYKKRKHAREEKI